MKNKFVASMMALFLGVWGVHWFYLGRIPRGLAYVALFAFFPFKIGIFLGIIDAIRIIGMPDHVFDRKFNSAGRYDEWKKARERWESRNKERNYERGRAKEWKRDRREQAPVFEYRRNQNKEKGMALIREYEFQKAISVLQLAAKDAPKDPEIPFQLACAYSIMEQAQEAFAQLEKAVSLGFKDLKRIHEHDLLAFVRIQDDWDEFVKRGYRQERNTIETTESAEEPILPEENLLTQLKNLTQLRQRGLLSEEQFLLEKEKLMR